MNSFFHDCFQLEELLLAAGCDKVQIYGDAIGDMTPSFHITTCCRYGQSPGQCVHGTPQHVFG